MTRCDCHDCTWLRASQIERAFIPKPPPQEYDPLLEAARKAACVKLGHDYIPSKDEVEKKIRELTNCLTPHYSWTGDTEAELRELVALARGTK